MVRDESICIQRIITAECSSCAAIDRAWGSHTSPNSSQSPPLHTTSSLKRRPIDRARGKGQRTKRIAPDCSNLNLAPPLYRYETDQTPSLLLYQSSTSGIRKDTVRLVLSEIGFHAAAISPLFLPRLRARHVRATISRPVVFCSRSISSLEPELSPARAFPLATVRHLRVRSRCSTGT